MSDGADPGSFDGLSYGVCVFGGVGLEGGGGEALGTSGEHLGQKRAAGVRGLARAQKCVGQVGGVGVFEGGLPEGDDGNAEVVGEEDTGASEFGS
jgi:hypothetical protein